MTDASTGPLTAFQLEVAHAFFDLPEAAGFLLAGGAGLAAQGLTARPTQDLDLFTAPGRAPIMGALAAFEAAVAGRGWTVRRVRVSATFSRVVVVAGEGESVVVDLAVDATPQRPPMMSLAGPTLDSDELAGRKVVALFDRAEARDFADVYALSQRFETERLLALAAEADAGFVVAVFADMLESVARFTDDEIPADDPLAVRRFAQGWAAQLRHGL